MFKSLIELFYPKVCAGCDELLLSAENVICTSCRHQLPFTDHFTNPKNEAVTKFYGKIPVEFAGAFLWYHKKGIVQQMIQGLKYKGREEIGDVLGTWLVSAFKAGNLPDVDVVIPVPLHRRKMRERGYNQVDALARAIARGLNKPFDNSVLMRNVYSKTQTKKNLFGRTELGRMELFGLSGKNCDPGRHFLLVDDVLTTGSTLETCARALLKIPGSRVSIVCLAMSHS